MLECSSADTQLVNAGRVESAAAAGTSLLHQMVALLTGLHSVLSPPCRSTQANKYSQEELLLMKTQDVKYLDTKSRSEAKVGRQAEIQAAECGWAAASAGYPGVLQHHARYAPADVCAFVCTAES